MRKTFGAHVAEFPSLLSKKYSNMQSTKAPVDKGFTYDEPLNEFLKTLSLNHVHRPQKNCKDVLSLQVLKNCETV